MTARFMRFAAATARQFDYLSGSLPSCIPPNLGSGRFYWEISVKGTGLPGINPDAYAYGSSVWDWDAGLNQYVLSSFAPTPSGYGLFAYHSHGSGYSVWADATTVIVAANGLIESSIDTKAGRGTVLIGAAASGSPITYGTAVAYAYDEAIANVQYYSRGTAYAGSIVFSYSNGSVSSTNGYVHKLSVSASGYSAALRSGLPTTTSLGMIGASMAALGTSSPNGYGVVDVGGNQPEDNVSRYQLVLFTGATPSAVGSPLTYTGYRNGIGGLLPISPTRVVALDVQSNVIFRGRVALLYTNSATTPSALTKGAEAIMPDPVDFAVADMNLGSLVFTGVASNAWFGDGKLLTLAYWERKSAAGGGIFVRPVIISSTGDTNISMSLPAVDINGRATPLMGSAQLNSTVIVSAPGNKAVMFVPGATTTEQYVYQL